MSYNTINLTPMDIDRRRTLYDKLKSENNITLEELKELRHILENEKYMAIRDGDLEVLRSIMRLIVVVDDYLTQKYGIKNIPIDLKLSNV